MLTYKAFSNGLIEFSRFISGVIDGEEISQTKHFVLAPGTDLTSQPADIVAVCDLWWTPVHLANYAADVAKAEEALGDMAVQQPLDVEAESIAQNLAEEA